MKIASAALLGWGLVLSSTGCGALGGGQGAESAQGGDVPPPERREASEQAAAGEQKRAQLLAAAETYQSIVTSSEEQLAKVAKQILGNETEKKRDQQGSLSKAVRELRAAGAKAPMLKAQPDIQQQGFYMLDQKIVTGAGAKSSAVSKPYGTASQHVLMLSRVTFMTTENAIINNLRAAVQVAEVVMNRKYNGLSPSDVDVQTAQKVLTVARRADQVSAAATALLATVKGVMDSPSADPKAIDDVATAVLAGVPSKLEVTNDEAKAHLDGFESGVSGMKEKYTAWLAEVYGPQWETSRMRADAEGCFAIIDAMKNVPTGAERRAAAKGEQPSGGGAPSGDAIDKGVSVARAVLPSDSPVRRAVDGFQSLRKGDVKGAVKNAMSFVPEGPIKSGLGIALKLFG